MTDSPVRRVAVVLFEGFTVLDVYGPVQAFASARTARPDGSWHRHFEIVTVAEKAGPVKAGEGPTTHADYAFSDAPAYDILLVPDAVRALGLIERHRVDWMYAVPTMMHRIWRLPEAERTRFDVSSLRVVFHMAAPCPMWLKEAWIGWLGPDRVLELYGGTEAQSFSIITGGEW